MITSRRKTSDIYNGCLSFLRTELTSVLPPNEAWSTGNIQSIVGNPTPVNAHNDPYKNPPGFIEIYFGTKYIFPFAYSLMGRRYDGGRLKSWEFYGRNKNNQWILLHKEDNNPLFRSEERTYQIKAKESFNGFKIYMTESNDDGNWALCLGQIEVFGDVYPTSCYFSTKINSCKSKLNTHSLSYQYIIVLFISN